MEIRHICSMLLVLYPVYRDIKERKIYILPAMILVGVGLAGGAASGNASLWQCLTGMIPGGILFLLGRLLNGCVGSGDCVLILGLGLLEGFYFCICSLAIAGGGIFLFSVAALLTGLVQKNSKVAFVPFLVLGYGGAGLL